MYHECMDQIWIKFVSKLWLLLNKVKHSIICLVEGSGGMLSRDCLSGSISTGAKSCVCSFTAPGAEHKINFSHYSNDYCSYHYFAFSFHKIWCKNL